MDKFKKHTELPSHYDHLEQMSTMDILLAMNQEDQTVPIAVSKVIDRIEVVVDEIVDRMLSGGRVFYIGAGTSGRLGILDASECPPTFGVDHGMVVGMMAGGDSAIRKAVEFAEDDRDGGWRDLKDAGISDKDFVIGIAASGTTPYVIGALEDCRKSGIGTASITCNPGSPVALASEFPIEVLVGPEFVTGSTRLKSGTAQKLVLNMISTAIMIKLGRVKGNKMVDMQLSNDKLIARGTKMVKEALGISYDEARVLLLQKGSVRQAIAEKSE